MRSSPVAAMMEHGPATTGVDALRLKQWVESWARAGERMEALRRQRLRNTDTQQSLLNLAAAFESCRLHCKPAPTSGLIEQQRWFKKAAQ